MKWSNKFVDWFKQVGLVLVLLLIFHTASAAPENPNDQNNNNDPNGKITICHLTNSETNTFVELTIDGNGLNGHEQHEGDLIPAPQEGCPNEATQIPSFPSCEDLTASPGDIAHFDSGLHQIAGGDLVEGTDDVYSLSDGNAVQCFCPLTGITGIQTNWWKTDEEQDGWISIENGDEWGLDEGRYLVKNLTFDCNNSGGGESGGANITVTKVVINDNNGTSVVSDFLLKVGQAVVTSGIQATNFTAGSYDVTESGDNLSDYNASFSGDCDSSGHINMTAGNDYTCTITNNDIGESSNQTGADITVTKVVTNDNGGTAVVGDFVLKVGQAVVTSGVLATNFPAGSYNITESGGPGGYTASFSGDCDTNGQITMVAGHTYSCAITNNDNEGTGGGEDNGGGTDTNPNITVTKVVINDGGGQAVVSDFTLKVGQAVVTSGVLATNFTPGEYDVTESGGPAGYTATFSGDCDTNGHISMSLNHNYVCTITNDDPGSGQGGGDNNGADITVTKVVINDNGGTAVVGDFVLKVGQAVVTSGVLATNFTPGEYDVTESGGPAGYTASFSGDCDSAGHITMLANQVYSCTITNNDNASDVGGGEDNSGGTTSGHHHHSSRHSSNNNNNNHEHITRPGQVLGTSLPDVGGGEDVSAETLPRTGVPIWILLLLGIAVMTYVDRRMVLS